METDADSARLGSMRQIMVSNQLRTNAVSDPRVIAVMARVPREAFFPSDIAGLAYRDTALPIGQGRFANLPIATGRLLNEAAVRPQDRVLLIGAASGYAAAVLSELASQVVAVENDPVLVVMARAALADRANVTVVEAPLASGHPAAAPYDLLVIDGAVEQVPDALIEQLAIGARVVSGIVDRGVTRLASGRRSASGFALSAFADLDCAILPGFAVPAAFDF